MVAQKRRIEPVDEPVFPEGPVDDELPALLDPQLRRRSDLAQKTRYFSESRGRVLLPRRVDRERIPPPVPRDSRDAPLEPAPRRDGFLVRAVAADPAEYVPDVFVVWGLKVYQERRFFIAAESPFHPQGENENRTISPKNKGGINIPPVQLPHLG